MQAIGGYYNPWGETTSTETGGWPTSQEYVPMTDASAFYAQQGVPATQKKSASYSGPTGSGTGKSRLGAGGEVASTPDTFAMWDPATFKNSTDYDAWIPQYQPTIVQQKFIDPATPHVRYRTNSVAPVITPPRATQQAPTSVIPTTIAPTQPIAGPPSVPVGVPSLISPNASPSKGPAPSVTPSPPGGAPAPLVRRNSRSGSIGSASGIPAVGRTADIESELQQQSLYKTELCRSWSETGTCRYGTKCQFAHGGEELRPVQRHPKYKTEVCRSWAATGTCPYGTRCRFIHNKSDRAADWALLQAAAQYSPTSPTGASPLAIAAAPSATEIDLFTGAFDTLTIDEHQQQQQSLEPEVVAPVLPVQPALAPSPARRPSIIPVASAALPPAPIETPTSLPPPPAVVPTSPVLPSPSAPLPPPLTQTQPTAAATPAATPSQAQAQVQSQPQPQPQPQSQPANKKEKRLPIFQRLTAALSAKGAKSSSKEKDSEEKEKEKEKKKK